MVPAGWRPPHTRIKAGVGDCVAAKRAFRENNKEFCMIRVSAFVLTIALFSSASLVAADPTDAVRAVAEGWYQAAVKQDAATLNRLLAEDLSYCHAGGKVQTKAEYIAGVMKGPPHYESMTYVDMKIKLYGKTAVLTSFADIKLTNTPLFRVRTLHVYVDNGGQWQLVAHESTRLGQ
jgi:ketosteroid isomerase-like protein